VAHGYFCSLLNLLLLTSKDSLTHDSIPQLELNTPKLPRDSMEAREAVRRTAGYETARKVAQGAVYGTAERVPDGEGREAETDSTGEE